MQLLLDRGYSVAAFDPSNGRESALTSIVGHRDNFLGLEHGGVNRTYDVVICSEVIEHILDEEYQNVLSRVTNFVADNGTLIITTPNQEDIGQKASFCPSCQHFFHPWQHVRSIHPVSLVEEFSKLGFTKLFLALIDFSNDAQTVEFGGILNRLIGALDRFEKSGVSVGEVFQRNSASESLPKGIWARLCQSLNLQSKQACSDPNAELINSQFVKMLADISEARQRLAVLNNSNQSELFSGGDELINLCVGNMNTIVYVGKKS